MALQGRIHNQVADLSVGNRPIHKKTAIAFPKLPDCSPPIFTDTDGRWLRQG